MSITSEDSNDVIVIMTPILDVVLAHTISRISQLRSYKLLTVHLRRNEETCEKFQVDIFALCISKKRIELSIDELVCNRRSKILQTY